MPPHLLQLPVETLTQIIGLCDHESLRQLRQVHQTLELIANPVFFRKYTLRRSNGAVAHMSDHPIFGAWLDKESPSNRGFRLMLENVQEFHVENLSDPPRRGPPDDFPDNSKLSSTGLMLNVQDIICSMKKLRELRWVIGNGNNKGPQMINLSSIADQITKLTIELYPYIFSDTAATGALAGELFSSFNLFSNLKYLDLGIGNPFIKFGTVFNNLPRLRHLKFHATGYGHYYPVDSQGFKATTIIDFFKAQTVPFKLQTLNVKGFDHRTSFPDEIVRIYFSELEELNIRSEQFLNAPTSEVYDTIWEGLRQRSVKLKRVEAWGECKPLLRYLKSYEGTLEVVKLKIAPYYCTNHTDVGTCRTHHDAVEQFMAGIWGDVIPAHKYSLRELCILPGSQHGGSYGVRPEFMSEMNEREPWRITDAAEGALVLCEKLEQIHLGSWIVPHLERAVEVAVRMPALRTLEYNLGGLSSRPSSAASWLDTSAHIRNKVFQLRHEVMGLRWDGGEVPEERWRGLDFIIVPLEKVRLEKDKRKSRRGMWKVVDNLSNLRELNTLI
ncbi:hypothetical protein TWF694_006325 [Orbilia ellipsospora]|uniref:F-box domain-containing protein n=1 Tax=Orbilia ellipsospora TaxID=2528407 RepID=A0AAV9XL92_9PEZI